METPNSSALDMSSESGVRTARQFIIVAYSTFEYHQSYAHRRSAFGMNDYLFDLFFIESYSLSFIP